jgi:hypothetical protein
MYRPMCRAASEIRSLLHPLFRTHIVIASQHNSSPVSTGRYANILADNAACAYHAGRLTHPIRRSLLNYETYR